MADGYGNVQAGHWKCHVAAWVSSDQTDYAIIRSECRIQTDSYNYASLNAHTGAHVNGVYGYADFNANLNVPANGETTVAASEIRINKNHGTQSIWCGGFVQVTGYAAGFSSADTSVSIGAKPSHTVSFNANGGSGAPSSQTKWYGEILTLSATKPTRANYTFLGWATSAGGAVAYQPGGQYGYDQNVTLYAKWKLNAKPPTISSFTVHRCDSSGTAQTDGEYVNLSCTWSVDTASDASNQCSSLKFAYQKDDGTWSEYAASASSGTGGTTSSIQNGFSNAKSWRLRVTLADKYAATTMFATIGPATYILDLNADGTGIGIGQIAPSEGVAIYGSPLNLNGSVNVNGYGFDTVSQTLISGTTGNVIGVRRGGVCMIHVSWNSANTASWGSGSFGILPEGWRPAMDMAMPFPGRDAGSQRNLVVKTDGTMTYANQGGSQNGGAFYGTFTYLTA